MILLKNILVATDFSEPSDAALAYGRALAQRFDATLHLLHVAENVFTRSFGGESYVTLLPDLQRDLEDDARKRLRELLIDNDQNAPPAKPVLVTSNTPAMAIVAYAKEAPIDLIVMGTHGRSGMSHMLMGSVAERVVRTAPCPVLTVRHPEHDFVVPDALVAVRASGSRETP